MSKPYRWTGESVLGVVVAGEAHTEEDAKIRAASMGCLNVHIEENPEFTDSDAIAATMPEVTGQTAADAAPKNKSDMQVLAEANTTLFNQVDVLKNQIATLELERDASNNKAAMLAALNVKALDAKALILAWNSEQIAKAAAENREYQEPGFMATVRELA